MLSVTPRCRGPGAGLCEGFTAQLLIPNRGMLSDIPVERVSGFHCITVFELTAAAGERSKVWCDGSALELPQEISGDEFVLAPRMNDTLEQIFKQCFRFLGSPRVPSVRMREHV